MKLLDKIKDLFMDDVLEEDEVEVEEEVKEEYSAPRDVLPTVMRETIKKEEGKIDFPEVKDKIEIKESKKLDKEPEVKETPKRFNFPIDFSDELNGNYSNKTSNINVLDIEKENSKKVSELYSKKDKKEDLKSKFKASPVISPVYGILDKNYSKDEVKEKSDDVSTMKRPSKKVDFETVRKKAFGNLADDIKDNLMCENCTLYQEAKRNNTLHEGDLLYDMTVDSSEEVTIEKAYDNYEEFGVSYEVKGKHEEEDDSEKENIIINNTSDSDDNELEKTDEIKFETDKIEDEEVPTRSNNKEKEDDDNKKDKVDDDFFELIDSMYKERSDE